MHTDVGRDGEHSLGDTHGVLALADQRLLVVLPLRTHRDELERVGPGTELPVGGLHPLAGAVCQVDTADGMLAGRRVGTLNTGMIGQVLTSFQNILCSVEV